MTADEMYRVDLQRALHIYGADVTLKRVKDFHYQVIYSSGQFDYITSSAEIDEWLESANNYASVVHTECKKILERIPQ